MRVLGWPLQDARTWTEEIAWLVAHGGAEDARWRVDARQLAAEARACAAEEQQARAELQAVQADVETARAALADVGEEVASWPPWLTALACAVGLAVLVCAASEESDLAAFAACAGAFALALGRARVHTQRQEREQRLVDGRQALEQAEELERQRTAALLVLRSRGDELSRRRLALAPAPRLRGVGRIYLALERIRTGRQDVLLDRSGLTAARELRVPDLGADAETLTAIRGALDDARAQPLVLDGDLRPGEIGRLHGQERELHAAVDAFTRMLEHSPVMRLHLPLVGCATPLARVVAQMAAGGPGQRLPGAVWHDGAPELADQARSLIGVAARLAQTGRDVDLLLSELQAGLDSTLAVYAGLRGDALAKLHAAVDYVLEPSRLLHVVWYCPKCNRVPAYLFHKLGVPLEAAHRCDSQTLIDRLDADEEIRRRLLADDQRVLRQLDDAWRHLREIDASHAEWQARGDAANLLDRRAHEARRRALATQQRELLEHFRACLRFAVSGNARPLLDLSAEARLYLDPDTGHWSCGVCSTVFEDRSVASMGCLLRIKGQLLMPMWNHLWTEKDDFRKSEMFRTNEQLLRLREKEVAALRDAAEQYRADMRPVRENLILALTEAQSKRGQLHATVSSMVASGLAPAEAMDEATARVERLTGGELEDYRRRAETKETLLDHEPQAQLLRRLPAVDPLHLLLTPASLFREEALAPERLLPAAATQPALP